jgi:integrase
MDLQPQQIQDLYNANVEKGIGLRTIEFTHSVFRGCLNHAVRINLLPKNPALAASPPKPRPDEMKILDEDQIQTFILAAQSIQPRNYPFFQLALTTGMRRSELLGLKWEDLEWIRGWLVVNRQLKRNKESGFFFAPPKTKAGYRTIVLGESTLTVLREHHQSWLDHRENFNPEWAAKNLMFWEPDGSPLRYRRVYTDFKSLLEEAALPDIRFHDLRHTAASQMITKGVDIITVSRRLGHAKVSVTLDIYGHLIPGVQEKAAAVMDDLTMQLRQAGNEPVAQRVEALREQAAQRV